MTSKLSVAAFCCCCCCCMSLIVMFITGFEKNWERKLWYALISCSYMSLIVCVSPIPSRVNSSDFLSAPLSILAFLLMCVPPFLLKGQASLFHRIVLLWCFMLRWCLLVLSSVYLKFWLSFCILRLVCE